MKSRLFFVLIALVLSASSVFAQSSVSVSYTISAPHDGLNTTDYTLTIDGTSEATKPVSALANGSIVFTGTKALNVGSHAAEITANGPGGQAKSTGTFTVSAPSPSKPGTVTIVIQVTTGP